MVTLTVNYNQDAAHLLYQVAWDITRQLEPPAGGDSSGHLTYYLPRRSWPRVERRLRRAGALLVDSDDDAPPDPPPAPADFEALAALDPRLAELAEEARAVEAGRSFCRNLVFVRDFKPRVCVLAGWNRDEGPAELQTSRAYDVMYDVVRGALPPCRGCEHDHADEDDYEDNYDE
jgi:hypothetical protein